MQWHVHTQVPIQEVIRNVVWYPEIHQKRYNENVFWKLDVNDWFLRVDVKSAVDSAKSIWWHPIGLANWDWNRSTEVNNLKARYSLSPHNPIKLKNKDENKVQKMEERGVRRKASRVENSSTSDQGVISELLNE